MQRQKPPRIRQELFATAIEIQPASLVLVESTTFRQGMHDGATWYFYGDTPQRPVSEADVVDFLQGNIVEVVQEGF